MNRRDPLAVAVDVLLGFALTAMVLLVWGTTYAGSRWLVVGLVAAAVGAGLAGLFAVRGWGVELLLLLLVPVYVAGAGPVASIRVGSGFVQRVLGGTIDAWTQLLGTHPRVDSRGDLLLAPYLVGLLCAGLTAGLALRSRSVGAPLGPPVIAFTAVLLLGRHEPDLLLGPTLGLVVLAAAWVLLRGLRREVPLAGRTVVPRLLGGALVIGLATALALPVAGRWDTTERPRLVLRDLTPTYDVAQLVTPLTQFRRFTEQPVTALGNLHDSALVTVTGLPEGTRLRFVALDRYDGTAFLTTDDTVPGRYDDRFLRVGRQLDNPAEGDEEFANVTVHKAYDGRWVPTAGALQWFGFDGRRSGVRAQGFRYDPATGTGALTSDLTTNDGYEFATVLTRDRLTRRMQPYPQLDVDLWEAAEFLDVPARAWSVGATSPMDAVFRVAATLRKQGRYSDGGFGFETKYAAGHGEQRLGEDFARGSLTGNDEQYAATMALAATRLGVPARVVVGAVLPRNGVVRGFDVRAWVELRIDDGSWRTLPTEAFMSTRPPKRDRFEENPDPYLKIRKLERREQQQPPQQQPELRPPDPEPSEPGPDLPPLPVLLLLLLAAAVGAVPGAKWLRRQRRRIHERPSRQYAGAWQELVDQARDLGNPVPDGLTRPAQAVLLGRGEDLAWQADRAIFGVEPPEADEATAYWTAVDAERRALRAEATPLQRVLAPWRLTSLRPPPATAATGQRPVGSASGVTSSQIANGSSSSSASRAASGGRGTA